MNAAEFPQGAPIHRIGADLHIEQVSLGQLAGEYGTPLFVYSKNAMLQALSAYQNCFSKHQARIHYAMKANSSLAILQVLAQAGCGFDIVSGGELDRALRIGVNPALVIFSGVGKTRAEMEQALNAGIGCFNVESLAELHLLDEVARALQVRAPVSIRVNPKVDAHTHPYISTALKDSKFGIAHEDTLAAYRQATALPGLRVVGIDCHIGSQITTAGPYLEAMDRMLDLVEAIEADGCRLEHLDFGGGLGIDYHGERPTQPGELWALLLAKLDARGHGNRKILIEPGRSLVGNAGLCLTQVLYVKPGAAKNFCIVDAAMNDVPRPAMYQAYHQIVAVHERSTESRCYDIVGPVCESGDWLGRDRQLAVLHGDILAVLSAGAYCMSMASNYNSRGRAAEVMVDGHRAHLIRSRESVQDVQHLERLL